jgi:Ni,Fe-hydrogenase III large subunit
LTAITHEVRQFPGTAPVGLRAVPEPGPPGEVRLRVSPSELRHTIDLLRRSGARFITMTLCREPERSILVVLAHRGSLIVLRSPDEDCRVLDGVFGEQWAAVAWAERELRERHGHPPSGRLLTEPDPDVLDRRVDGLDAFVIPYGPVRSGIFEAIQFQIETGCESVVALQTRPFFKHRGLEQRFRGMPVAEAVHVAERVAGIASVAYASAFSQAVERAIGIDVSIVAQRWRAFHAELERIACHLDVIAKEAETTALYVGQARFQILKERAMRLRARLSGSRFGRGVVCPGGVRVSPAINRRELLREIDELEHQYRRDRHLFLATASMTDRLIGSGHLTRELIDEYGAVGPLARGSGVATDARHERPYGDYRRLGLMVMTRREGDAMARINVRFDEVAESLRILRQALEHFDPLGEEDASSPPERTSGSACGWVEAPQGELLVWVEVEEGCVANVHLASPSFRNWALFDHAFPSDVLTDFAFIEHSFGLTPAGADR